MLADFQQGVFIDEVITLEGVGDIPVKLTEDSVKRLSTYRDALKLHRGIRNEDDVNIADPIVLFHIVTLTLGQYDADEQAKIVNEKYQSVSEEIAQRAIVMARQYHREALASINNEVMLVCMLDEIFNVGRNPDTKQVQVTIKDGLTLPPIPANYFDDTEANQERTDEGLPPRFPRNPALAVEMKLAHINALLGAYPSLMGRVQGFLTRNIVTEIRKEIAKGEKGAVAPDGFRTGTTDNPVSV